MWREKEAEAKANGCGSARGAIRWEVKVGLIESMTLGQRLGGRKGVSYKDEWRRMFSAKGTASDNSWKAGECLYCARRPEDWGELKRGRRQCRVRSGRGWVWAVHRAL